MESKQPTSHEQSSLETRKPEELAESVTAKVKDSNVEDHKPVKPDVSYLLTGEVLSALIDEKSKSKSSWLQKISNNAVVVVFFGGVITALLTYYYTYELKNLDYAHSVQQRNLDFARNVQQQELIRQRSFLDEVNKVRVQKLGEVWEQIDKNEVILSSLLERANESSKSNHQKNQNVDVINSLIQEGRVIVNKNRFWLGEQNYDQIKDYLDKNLQLARNMLLARPGTDLSEIIEKREQTKQDILQIRKSMLLEGERLK
ncbi:MAG: hypothetical protein AABN95_08245 [Acidobacteriota bacterium]